MIKFFSRVRTALLLAAVLCTASCERKTSPVPPAVSPQPEIEKGITFVKGFHLPDTLTPTTTLRWVHRDAVLRVEVPTDGHYQITFRAFTVFSKAETTIEIGIGGESAGKFSTTAFDLGDAVPATVELDLHAGGNDLLLHASRPEARLGENDERLASFGLLLPIVVDPAP